KAAEGRKPLIFIGGRRFFVKKPGVLIETLAKLLYPRPLVLVIFPEAAVPPFRKKDQHGYISGARVFEFQGGDGVAAIAALFSSGYPSLLEGDDQEYQITCVERFTAGLHR